MKKTCSAKPLWLPAAHLAGMSIVVLPPAPFHGSRSLEMVLYLLKMPGVDINRQGSDGHTGKHLCIVIGTHSPQPFTVPA
jgi:hypothetical protein